MQEEARDIESLRAQLDQRMRELVGEVPDEAPGPAEIEVTEPAQPPPPERIFKISKPKHRTPPDDRRFPTLEEVERRYIVSVLEARNWRVSGPKGAARILGLNPSTLRSRMKKLGISRYM